MQVIVGVDIAGLGLDGIASPNQQRPNSDMCTVDALERVAGRRSEAERRWPGLMKKGGELVMAPPPLSTVPQEPGSTFSLRVVLGNQREERKRKKEIKRMRTP